MFDATGSTYVGTAVPVAGSYSISLPPATYTLWVQPNTAGYVDLWYDGPALADADPIDISAGNASANIVIPAS